MTTTTTDIICTECNTKPRLKSLDKNSGTCVGCDCDGAKYSMDTVPYELTVADLPEPWEVADGLGWEGHGLTFQDIYHDGQPLEREHVEQWDGYQ